jgi:glycosyltransferase 2 family protein
MNVNTIRNRLLLSILFGVLVYAGLTAFSDFEQVAESFGEFRWELLPLILLVTCGNYALRFVKWQYYLHMIGVRGLRAYDSFLIFFSGLGMVVTPGKVGEWLKSYLLREMHGTPVMRSAPILLAERLTDSLALLVIGGIGVAFFGPQYWWVVAVIAGGSAIAVAVSRHRPTARAIIRFVDRLPVVGRFARHMEEMYESTYILMEPRAVLLMTGLSICSWFFEVMAFYLTLVGLGVSGDIDTLLKAAFILPIATLVAAIVVFAPGGLGVAEGSITALSRELIEGLSAGAAAVGTVIIRIATLWFGVIVGLITFAVLTRKLTREGKTLDVVGEEEPPAYPPPMRRGDAEEVIR